MLQFDSVEEAHQKLAQTVIFWRDRPIFIHSVKGNSSKTIIIQATDLPLIPSGDPYDLRIDILDKDLDWHRLGERLGYLNVDYAPYKQALYICRYPVRKSIQGLSKQNVNIPHLLPRLNYANDSGKTLYYENMLGLKGFVDMLHQVYPKYDEIKDRFGKHPEAHSYAFHRWFAVTRKQIGPMFLAYKGLDIGWSEDMLRWNLDKKYNHLSETLEDQGIDFKF